MREALHRLRAALVQGAGPHVSCVVHAGLALVGLIAWLSWWVQIEVLVGAEGLAPASELVRRVEAAELGFTSLPTLLLFTGATPFMLHALCAAGTASCALALFGRWVRPCFALSAIAYLSLVAVCGPFSAFQWDNMLVECFALGALLPRDRASLVHFALRVLLWKLYFGSGMAKWQSPLGDWIDGSAMTYYYETTPLPTPVSWWMHNLPDAWHRLESWATLVLEIVVPWGAFGGRRVRHATALTLTGFQGLNLLTGNFGFFVYLSLVLHLSLLEEGTCARLWRRLPWRPSASHGGRPSNAGRAVSATLVGLYLVASVVEQAAALSWLPATSGVAQVRVALAPFRLVNSYALFASVTRERFEPILEVDAGQGFSPRALHHKPGPADRPLGWVAPHQPRVDFRLWFYGLRSAWAPPPYVARLMRLACERPVAIQGLFVDPLPRSPSAVRIRFEQFRFSDWDERRATGQVWVVESVQKGPSMSCERRAEAASSTGG